MWVSNIPKIINAGTTQRWEDEPTTVPINQNITSAAWTLTYYLRSKDAGVNPLDTGQMRGEDIERGSTAFNRAWALLKNEEWDDDDDRKWILTFRVLDEFERKMELN